MKKSSDFDEIRQSIKAITTIDMHEGTLMCETVDLQGCYHDFSFDVISLKKPKLLIQYLKCTYMDEMRASDEISHHEESYKPVFPEKEEKS